MECLNCHTKLKDTDYFCPKCKHLVFENLVRDAKSNNQYAYDCLMNYTYPHVFREIRDFINDDALAEDIVVKAFTKGFIKLETLKDPNAFQCWITKIAINESKNHFEIKNKTEIIPFASLEDPNLEISIEETIEDTSPAFSPEENVNYSEMEDGIRALLQELPEKQRIAIESYYFEKYKIKDIAEKIQVPEGTVKILLYYGRNSLRDKVNALKKQNKSFYTISPIPFLVWMLQKEVDSITMPADFTEKVIKNVSLAKASGTTTTSAAAASRITGTTVAKGVSSKVIAGIVAGTVGVGAVGVGVVHNFSTPSNPQQAVVQEVVEEDDGLTKYTVLNVEVPDFEITPIDNETQDGYLVKVDNSYGFIDTEGQFIIDPSYQGVMLSDLDGSYGTGFEVCLFPDSSQTNITDGLSVDGYLHDNGITNCGHGLGGAGLANYLSVDNQVISSDVSNTIYTVSLDESIVVNKLNREFTDGMDLYSNAYTSIGPNYYYIVTPSSQVFGPYDASLKATFMINNNVGQVQDIEKISGLFNSYVKGLFYEETEDGYIIWNKDGTKSYPDTFDFAEPISDNAMKIEKDGKLGVVNQDLELVLLGDFEDVSNVINNHCYIKINGTWKLITLDETK